MAYTWEGGVFEGQLLHSCDNPSCVRPSHLKAGTQAENLADARGKGRKDDRGQGNPYARLTDGQVREIREVYARGGRTQTGIAEQFGIDQTTVSDIVTRRRWRHVL